MIFQNQFECIFDVKFSYRIRTKKRLIYPGKTSVKKKKKKKVLSTLESPTGDGKTLQNSTLPEHNDVPDDIEEEKVMRKSTRTSVIVRQAERDAIRAALQATMKVSSGYHSIYPVSAINE